MVLQKANVFSFRLCISESSSKYNDINILDEKGKAK